ncbi:Fic family protein [Endozoicomonas sp. 4G]|uniref:Fic family protein n=1 Tax=Endozoicomonas sp. 4G TaxID=2872754 RepID=UPI002078A8EC|nr:Fic family protein [Endozoicomonas sp. 4G]
MAKYQPPYTITPAILDSVANISELLGRYSASQYSSSTPRLRRNNRIRTIQASLAIEHNTLSVEQVTAILEGKRVLGQPKEILEVQNAFKAYDLMPTLDPANAEDLLQVHAVLMKGLTDQAGCWRNKGVGIYRDEQLVHMPPPPSQVARLIAELFAWIEDTGVHPLIGSCIFHYEFEFIHPFTDGNGRMGRFWQTLILSKWREPMAFLPVETIIRDQQNAYYQALRQADTASDSTPFIAFILKAIEQALNETLMSEPTHFSDQVIRQVSDQVKNLLLLLLTDPEEPFKVQGMMEKLGLKHRPTFRKNYLKPALDQGLIIMTNPDSPNSPRQSYQLSTEGLFLAGKVSSKN